MDKNGLGPVLDENGNIKHVMSKDDKIKIFTDTLIESADPNAGNTVRDHVAIDMFDVVSGVEGVAPDFRPRPALKPRQGTEKLRMHHVFVSANECVDLLEKVRRRLAQFASRHQVPRENDPDFAQLAELSGQIMTLSRDAFVPAHCLCSAVIGLYMTEDYIREPTHGEFPNYNEGRIRIPSKRTNRKTLLQLHMCVDTVTEFYAKFQPGPRFGVTDRIAKFETEEMKIIVVMLRQMMQELYATGSGCFDLLNILVYIDPPEQDAFTGFLNNLNSMEKSDLLEGISKLRRTVDLIPLLLEKLSWASYAVYRLATGQSPTESPADSGAGTPVAGNSRQLLEAAGGHSQSRGQIGSGGSSNLHKKGSETRIVRDSEVYIDQRQGQRSKVKERAGANEPTQVDRHDRDRDRDSRLKDRKHQHRKKEGNGRR